MNDDVMRSSLWRTCAHSGTQSQTWPPQGSILHSGQAPKHMQLRRNQTSLGSSTMKLDCVTEWMNMRLKGCCMQRAQAEPKGAFEDSLCPYQTRDEIPCPQRHACPRGSTTLYGCTRADLDPQTPHLQLKRRQTGQMCPPNPSPCNSCASRLWHIRRPGTPQPPLLQLERKQDHSPSPPPKPSPPHSLPPPQGSLRPHLGEAQAPVSFRVALVDLLSHSLPGGLQPLAPGAPGGEEVGHHCMPAGSV